MKYFGGIEGGATHSRLIICSDDGECVTTTTGLGTNHWMVGIGECARRIADMIERAKEDAKIPQETRLTSLGLSLSGCEQEATNKELEMELRTSFPDIADHYYVCSDTMGSIATASPSGGMVFISGTGSNALLMNPDGTSFSCGGWGHFLGDEGSAWYIAHRAMKLVFEDMDNFSKAPHPIDTVWKLIQEHFNIHTRLDLLPHCYAKFDKPFFASFCKKLSHAAEDGDNLAKFLFHEAGEQIATHINALVPKVHNDLVKEGDLNVVCVGSVWLSWPLLKEGFLQQMKRTHIPFGLKLIRITQCMAYGACYLGADSISFPLPRNYFNNYKVMYHYEKSLTNGNISLKGNHSITAE